MPLRAAQCLCKSLSTGPRHPALRGDGCPCPKGERPSPGHPCRWEKAGQQSIPRRPQPACGDPSRSSHPEERGPSRAPSPAHSTASEAGHEARVHTSSPETHLRRATGAAVGSERPRPQPGFRSLAWLCTSHQVSMDTGTGTPQTAKEPILCARPAHAPGTADTLMPSQGEGSRPAAGLPPEASVSQCHPS